jgi:exoribonuclease R
MHYWIPMTLVGFTVYLLSYFDLGNEFHAVFISTVRTQYLLEDLGKSNIDQIDDSIDLGFLTDTFLLNTILTRTKYLVCVVGDPIALCAIGKCTYVWKKYIERCDELGRATFKNWNFQDIEFRVKNFVDSSNIQQRYSTDNENDAEADAILTQLASEATKSCNTTGREGLPEGTCNTRKPKYIVVKEKKGHAIPFLTDVNTNVEEDQVQLEMYENIKKQPDRYKQCIILMSNVMKIRAKVKNPKDSITEILIGSRRRCGQAFNNDEVCVEILPNDEEDGVITDQDSSCEAPQGQVVAILKRALNLKYKRFVCTVDAQNPGMMIPLNKGIPKMANIAAERRIGHNRPKGTVCLYKNNPKLMVQFNRYEPATFPDGTHKLFVVQFLKWQQGFNSPLCVAVDVLQPGTTLEAGLKVLDINHFVTRNYERTNHIKQLPKQYDNSRKDIRHILTFTIDPTGCEDIDDALSVEELPGGRLQLGVHITDVSACVEIGSKLDEGAYKRGTSMYPAGADAIPMLPRAISYDRCSLKRGEDRNTISVFFTVKGEHDPVIMEAPSMNLTVINSKHQLCYDDAETILNNKQPDQEQDLYVSLNRLHVVTQAWRKQRLGDSAYCHGLDPEAAKTPKAHLLVQEMMIAANHHVAEILLDCYPECVPLRSQLPPNKEEMDRWRDQFKCIAKNSFDLKQQFRPSGAVCHCTNACMCMSDIQDSDVIILNKMAWLKAMSNIKTNTDVYMPFSITVPDNLPEAMAAHHQLKRIQEKAMYVCSGEYSHEMAAHHSLNMNAYTHFTSPLRRYIDIVVTRMLVARMKGHTCPYTSSEVSTICTKCTESSQRARDYENATERLYLATILQKNSATIYPVVEYVSSSDIQLGYVLSHN